MPEPTAFLEVLRSATAELLSVLEKYDWSAADVAAPSLCTGWTRGHVLTHIARNADGIADTVEGALRGEIVERYPDGWDARNAAIDAGSTRPYEELVEDVRNSAERVDRVLQAVQQADGWELPTAENGTPEGWVYRRTREVLVHHVDLAGDYTPDRWPALFVSTELPEAAKSLETRVTEGAVRVSVTADGSVSPDHVGAEWFAGSGEPVDVSGPDWAVLVWLAGRAAAARGALTATPELGEWR
jgi:maleylpyruvate isomerase